MTPQTPSGRCRVLPAGAGLAWLGKSLGLLRRQPARLLLLAVVMQAILGLSQIPLIGIVVILAVPALTAGMLQALRNVDLGRPPALAVLFLALSSKPRTGRLFAFGAVLFGVGVLCVTLALGTGGSGLDQDLLSRIEAGDLDALASIDTAFVMRFAMALAIAVSITGVLSYLTVPLIWFNGLPLGRALAEGLRAMAVNWKPFGVLAIGLAALVVPVALVIGGVIGAMGISPAGSMLTLFLLVFAALMFQLVVFATQYCAHEALFGIPEDPADAGGDGSGAGGPGEPEDQFVA